MRHLVCSLLLIVHLLSAEDGDFPYSLTDYLKSPIPRAAGSVNVVSGDWLDQTTHLETTGPDPYVVAHSYCSASLDEGTLADGWDFFHPSELEVYQPYGISYTKKSLSDMPKGQMGSGPATLYYREAGGATVVFETTDIGKGFHPKIDDVGYAVVSSIDQPARRSAERIRVKWQPKTDAWVVELGDGTRRTYLRSDKERFRSYSPENYYKRAYHICEERLPSGNRRQYQYDKDNELCLVKTLSSDEKFLINTARFQRQKDQVEVTTSEGLITKFHFKKLKDRKTARVVDSIDRPGLSPLSYEYTNKSTKHSRRVRSKTTGKRPDVPKYYHEKKFLEDRVREVWTKDFSGRPLTLSHSFTYVQGSVRNRTKVRESDGSTTTYSWWKTKLPHQVKVWDAKDTLLRRERFTWNKSRLTHRAILDAKKKPILDREYVYDEHNNVVCEHLRGLFSGRTTKPPAYDAKGHLTGAECLTRWATYDSRSLKTGEIDALGNWTYYEYEPDRELLTARFTCDQSTILRREFFQYNSAAVCTQSIIDDGSSKDPLDMTGVTRRTIRRITARSVLPYFGTPDEIRTSIWTSGGGEKLAHIERFTRNDRGLATIKEILDANQVLQKRWSYEYDACGRIVRTLSPDGGVEEISYDHSGRIASKTTPEAATIYTYDLLDRLIEEKKVYPDGSSDSVCSQYDLSGRVCTKIDGRGRTTTTAKDLLGRPIWTCLPAIATENGVVQSSTQNFYDNLTEYHVSPKGVTTTIVRSAAGLPLRSSTPGKGETLYFYDALSRLVEQRDPSGLVTLTTYDALGRVTRVEQVANNVSVSVVTTTYQGSDIVEERYPTKAVNYMYDEWGRRTSETITDLLTGQSVVAKTEYDALHRPVRLIHEASSTEERISYDAADRQIERRVLGSDGSLLSITTKTYDTAGRTIEEGVGRNGTIAPTKTTYGAYGLPSSITYPDGTKTIIDYNPLYQWVDGHTYLRKGTTDARGVVTEQLLDSNDQSRLTTVKDPFGALLLKQETFFSVLGHPTRIDDSVIENGQINAISTTKLEYNSIGLCTACMRAAGTTDAARWSYLYDDIGRKISETKPSGTSFSYSYDPQGRLSDLESLDGSVSWAYTYNSQGLPEAVTDRIANAATRRTYNGLGAVIEETFATSLTMGFDFLPGGFLSSITYPDGTKSNYTYEYGRLRSISKKNHTYTVNSRDLSGLITDATLPDSCGHCSAALDLMGRQTLISHPSFTEERTLFDPVGCLLERTIDGQHESFSYDYLCQLTLDNGRSARYDSLHRRVETEGKAAVHNSLHQITAQGDLRYVYDRDGRRISDGSHRYTYDALDRLIRAQDDSARYDYAYDPFNRRLSTTTSVRSDDGWLQKSVERYLWHGDREIGSVDEQGNVLSLRVLGEGPGAEIGSAVLIEVGGESYVPLHDLCGHVRVLLSLDAKEAERLSYTAYGLSGRTSNIAPWTFSSKRQDPTGLVYFGQRYYDPETATWMTLDPLGNSAGSNLYAYVKNNPLTCFDQYGLFGESFGGVVSDLVDTVCDAFDTVVNFVCDVFSGIANAFSGWGGSGEDWSPSFSEHASGYSAQRVERTLSYAKRSPQTASQRNVEKLFLTQILIHPFGSVEEFVKANAGSNLKEKVFVEIPGANTTLREAVERAEMFVAKNQSGCSAVVILYNSTQGVLKDLFEATLNSLGFDLPVGTTLKNGFIDFLQQCQQNDIHFEATFICHSQGVSIGDNIIHSQALTENPSSCKYLGEMLNLGGPKIVPGAINCVAVGDPVSLLSLINLPAVANAAWNGELHFFLPTNVEFPHSYCGSAYQQAIQTYAGSP